MNWRKMKLRQLREVFDSKALPPASIDRGVVAEWPDPSVAPPLAGRGWRTAIENTWYEHGGAIREWVLLRTTPEGEERFSVKLYVSSTGALPARKYFRRQATNSTSPERLFERELSPEPAVLYLRASSASGRTCNDSLLHLYDNIVLELRAFDAEVDVRAVGRWLQGIAEGSDASLSQSRPPLAQPELPEELRPGDQVRLDVPAVPDPLKRPSGDAYQVEVQTSGEAVDFLGFRDKQAWFRLPQPGEGSIRLQAIDRRTLLSQEIQLDLQVRPEEPPTA